MITPRQRDLLLFIAAYQAEHQCAPTYREMADGIGIRSTGRAHALAQGLVARGYLAQGNGWARTLSVLRMPDDPPVRCPHCRRLIVEHQAPAASAVHGRTSPGPGVIPPNSAPGSSFAAGR